MTQRIYILLVLIFLSALMFGQVSKEDSQRKMLDSLNAKIKEAKRRASGCTEFKIKENPEWADSNINSKTYYRNCMWSGTYIVINFDSTFLYLHNGEGGANYLVKGNWRIKKDSVLALTGNDRLTNEFKLKIKSFQKTDYKIPESFMREYIKRQNILLKYED